MPFMSKYNLRLASSGNSIRQEKINDTKQFYQSAWADDISFRVVPINNMDTEVRIYDVNSKTKHTNVKNITRIDGVRFNFGDTVVFKDRHWLFIERDDTQDEILDTGIIQECNYLLKWMGKDGKVHECWSISDDGTKYSPGVIDGHDVVAGNTRMEVTLPRTEETLTLIRDTRVLISNNSINPNAYKISKINDVTVYDPNVETGLITLIFLEDEFNPLLDNADLMVANYYGFTSLKLLTPESLNLNPNDTYQIQAQVEFDNTIVTPPPLSYKSLNNDVATVDESGLITCVGLGLTQVKITYYSEVVTVSVDVVDVPVIQDRCHIHYSGLPSINLGSTKTLDVTFYNEDGIEEQDLAIWSVVSLDNTPFPFVTIQSQVGNKIILRCKSGFDNIGKKFKVVVIGSTLNVTDSLELEIQSV